MKANQKMSNDPIILSYDESLLRKSDLELLEGCHWLNDNIISFYFELLKNTYKAAPFLLFIAPEVTQCIKLCPQTQLEIFLEPLQAAEKKYIFFALNDNDCPQFAGGCHWSLLLFSRPDRKMYHFDSSYNTNSAQGDYFATKIFNYFGIHGCFQEEPTVQQRNGYDCGIFLICFAEQLARYLSTNKQYRNCGLDPELYERTLHMREQIIGIVNELKKD